MTTVIPGHRASIGWKQKLGLKQVAWKGLKQSTNPITPCTQLSLLSLNIWFDNMFQTERFSAIISTIEQLLPDLVALQEVTDGFYNLLVNSKSIQLNYYISDFPSSRGNLWYGTMLLVKKCPYLSVEQFSMTKLPTRMGRALISAHIQTSKYSIMFGTVHFESGFEDWPVRQQQLEISTDVLKADIPILCGDFNVYNDTTETEFITSLGWKDAWLKPVDVLTRV